MVRIAEGAGAREVPMVPTQCHGRSACGRSDVDTERDAEQAHAQWTWCAPVVRASGARDRCRWCPRSAGATACLQCRPVNEVPEEWVEVAYGR